MTLSIFVSYGTRYQLLDTTMDRSPAPDLEQGNARCERPWNDDIFRRKSNLFLLGRFHGRRHYGGVIQNLHKAVGLVFDFMVGWGVTCVIDTSHTRDDCMSDE